MHINDYVQLVGTLMGIAGFVMYLLDKAGLKKFAHLPRCALLLIGSMCLIIALVSLLWSTRNHFSRSQEQAAEIITGDMSLKFIGLNNLLGLLNNTNDELQKAKQQSMAALSSEEKERIKDTFSRYLRDYAMGQINDVAEHKRPEGRWFDALKATNVPMKDVNIFYDTLFASSVEDFRDYHEFIITNMDLLLSSDWMDRAIALKDSIVHCYTYGMYYGYLGLLADMPSDVRKFFYDSTSTLLTNFPDIREFKSQKEGAEVSLEKDDASRIANKYLQKVNEFTIDLSEFVGVQNRKADEAASELRQLKDKQDVNKILKEKIGLEKKEVGNLQNEAKLKRQKIDSLKESLRKKNQLKPDDDQWLMWGKIIKFATVKLYRDAISSLDTYLGYVKGKDAASPVYVAAAKAFYRLLEGDGAMVRMQGIPLDSMGVLVFGFENNLPHSCVKVGDILLFSKNEPVHRHEDFFRLSSMAGSKSLVLYRLNRVGNFERLTVYPTNGDPKIGVLDLRE